MMLREWKRLPFFLQTREVFQYYTILKKKKGSLFLKRIFDILVSIIMLFILMPVFLILAVIIKIDSPGPVFFRQTRITQYGKEFRIHKLRTMINDSAEGLPLTLKNDARITKLGRVLRKYKIDEAGQLLDVLAGNMTFVGTRPEIPKYIESYTPEMMATLLLPAGITSLASIYYKDEEQLLKTAENISKAYVENILPAKMYYNLKEMRSFSLWKDIQTIVSTVLAISGREYCGDYIFPDVDANNKENLETETNRIAH